MEINVSTDLNAKLAEIRSMNATKDEKNELSKVIANEYANAYMNAMDSKSKKSYASWTDLDVLSVFQTIKMKYGNKDEWKYGLIKSNEFKDTLEGISLELNRTTGGVTSLIKIATHNGNISPAKKDKGALDTTIRYKILAHQVGLITEKSFVSAIYNGYSNNVINLDGLVTCITNIADIDNTKSDVIDKVENVEDAEESIYKKTISKLKSIRKIGERYTFDERVGIFEELVKHVGTADEVESTYGNTSFCGFPPVGLKQSYDKIAKDRPNRTMSAIKNTVDNAVFVARNPNRKYTKSKIEIYEAAIEAGFIV